MSKVVIFDLLFAQPIGSTNFHGGGEYTKSVFHALMKSYDGAYDLLVCYDTACFLDPWILELIQNNAYGVQVADVKAAADIVRIVSEKARESEVRFFAGMIYPYDHFEFPESVTCIGTCHGLRTLEKPYDVFAPCYIQNKAELKELLKYTLFRQRTSRKNKNIYENSIKRFDIVITVSEHSAYSIRVNFPELMRDKEIRVFYTPEKYVEPISGESDTNGERYIMMISANRWLKNSYRGVMALDALYQKGLLPGVKTKVFGNLPARIQKKVKCKDCFEFLGYVDTKDLEMAYKNCEVFFYPTLNEGFGLPPMEAMKYGKTCVISNVCSLPEVYGESVYYCNPYDLMEMQNRILQAVERKIEPIAISKQLNLIQNRQNTGLGSLVDLIKGEVKHSY